MSIPQLTYDNIHGRLNELTEIAEEMECDIEGVETATKLRDIAEAIAQQISYV